MLFSASSQWPGIMQLAMFRFPLNYGFSRMFQISLKLSSLLSLPAVFIISSGFMSCATHQMSSMANSGLLPRYLKRNIEVENSNSLLAFATCVVICLVVLFPMGYTQYHHRSALFCIAVMASYIVNMIYLSAFIMFRKKYSSLKKFFVNPLGVVGAGYGIFVFLTTFTSAAAFQNDQQIPIIILSGILIFACIYYQLVARTMQCFSEEEQRVLFVAYVINGKT